LQKFKKSSESQSSGVNDMILISIGTGIEARPYSFKRLEKAGKLAG
jgi:hypothetical protein